MQISSNNYIQTNETFLESSTFQQFEQNATTQSEETTIEEQISKSAVEVSLSMNAQIVLFSMDAQDYTSNNTSAQNAIMNFLSGKEVEGELSLKDIGYEGKAITELSEEEATELISEDGFFGIDQTSQRVADFVLSFSNDNIDIIEKAREGVVQGFEDAKKIWGEDLPQISYDTQAKTLELIDQRLTELKSTEEIV